MGVRQGQRFTFVAPRVRSTVSKSDYWGAIVREFLYDTPADIVRHLVIPFRQEGDDWGDDDTAANGPANSAKDMSIAERGTKRGSDYVVRGRSSWQHKQIKGPATNEEKNTNTQITVLCLPAEVHHLIFYSIEEVKDVISLGLTNRHFWSCAYECLKVGYLALFGGWAGTNLICLGEDVKPNDYPNGLFSIKELEALRQEMPRKTGSSGNREVAAREREIPFALGRSISFISTPEKQSLLMHVSAPWWLLQYIETNGRTDYAFKYAQSQLMAINETLFPKEQKWILRNLTKKQFVRSEAIALSPDDIRGPFIGVLGFGEVVMSRIFWSSSDWLDVETLDPAGITRGVWAGDCFDITTISRHEAGTCKKEWNDASEEVSKEIAIIWEAFFGAKWRLFIREQFRYRSGFHFEGY